jgi:hypothetical protein
MCPAPSVWRHNENWIQALETGLNWKAPIQGAIRGYKRKISAQVIPELENGGGGSPALTSLRSFSAEIQGKITKSAGKAEPAGNLSQDLRTF